MLYWKQYRKLKRDSMHRKIGSRNLAAATTAGDGMSKKARFVSYELTLARISKSQKLAEGVFQTTSDLTLRVQK